MPEAPSDIDYTVDVGRHESVRTHPNGEEFLGGTDLTMPNEERIHSYRMPAQRG